MLKKINVCTHNFFSEFCTYKQRKFSEDKLIKPEIKLVAKFLNIRN